MYNLVKTPNCWWIFCQSCPMDVIMSNKNRYKTIGGAPPDCLWFQSLFLRARRSSRMIFCSTEAIIFLVFTTVSGLREM